MPIQLKTEKTITLVFLMIAFSVLSGCGTKGPLYIPEKQYPQENT